jgi:hypothetical protein
MRTRSGNFRVIFRMKFFIWRKKLVWSIAALGFWDVSGLHEILQLCLQSCRTGNTLFGDHWDEIRHSQTEDLHGLVTICTQVNVATDLANEKW